MYRLGVLKLGLQSAGTLMLSLILATAITAYDHNNPLMSIDNLIYGKTIDVDTDDRPNFMLYPVIFPFFGHVT